MEAQAVYCDDGMMCNMYLRFRPAACAAVRKLKQLNTQHFLRHYCSAFNIAPDAAVSSRNTTCTVHTAIAGM